MKNVVRLKLYFRARSTKLSCDIKTDLLLIKRKKLNSVTSILLSSQPIKWYRMYRTSMFRVCASSVSLVRLKEKPDYYVSLIHKFWMKIRASPSLAFIIILKIINHGDWITNLARRSDLLVHVTENARYIDHYYCH